MTDKTIVHLSGLNGLRAIAALSVLFAHVMMEGISDFRLPIKVELPMAGFGVTLFFVISGFLITYLLLLEKEKSKVNIKNFYVRRILRIWPIYYLYIGSCLILGFFNNGMHEVFTSTITLYMFFAANVPFILTTGILILVHYWSIGVEEQFYLFWPWVVKFSSNKLLFISIGIFILLFGLQSIMWFLHGHNDIIYRILMVTRFHCMMIGAIGAILYKNQNLLFLQVVQQKWLQILSWGIFILMGIGVLNFPAPMATEIIAFISLFIIMGQVTIKSRMINLERNIPDFLGKISYGIYVIHPMVIFSLSMLFKQIEINLYLKYALVYISVFTITIVLAYLSYEFYEKPFLSLKSRFSTVLSYNSRL